MAFVFKNNAFFRYVCYYLIDLLLFRGFFAFFPFAHDIQSILHEIGCSWAKVSRRCTQGGKCALATFAHPECTKCGRGDGGGRCFALHKIVPHRRSVYLAARQCTMRSSLAQGMPQVSKGLAMASASFCVC